MYGKPQSIGLGLAVLGRSLGSRLAGSGILDLRAPEVSA